MSCEVNIKEAVFEGRGEGFFISFGDIEDADVVIVWGDRVDDESIEQIEAKEVIVIDPKKTELAKKANLHIDIKAQTDIYLALLLSRFSYINNTIDESFLKEYAGEYEDFYELTQTVRIKSALELMGISLGDIGEALELIENKKVVIICGLALQDQVNIVDTLRAIDGFAVMLGLFAKEGCGVIYIDKEIEDYSSFFTKSARVSKSNSEFDGFNTKDREFIFLEELDIDSENI